MVIALIPICRRAGTKVVIKVDGYKKMPGKPLDLTRIMPGINSVDGVRGEIDRVFRIGALFYRPLRRGTVNDL